MPPNDWGWQMEDDDLIPIRLTAAPAPDELPKLVSCARMEGSLTT